MKDSLTVLTARKDSLYYQAAKELESALRKSAFTLNVKESPGSFQNLEELGKGNADMAFAQQDAFALLRNLSDENLAKLSDNIQVFAPVNNEIVHILVNKNSGINRFQDLSGKAIGVGPQDSGTYISALLLCQLNNFDVTREHFNKLEVQEAIEKVRKGELDAAFYTAGSGAPLLKNISAEKGKTLKLLSIDSQLFTDSQQLFKDKSALYRLGKISAHTYPWQNEDVNAISTFSFLYIRKTLNANKVYQFAKAAYSKAPELRSKDSFWQLFGTTQPMAPATSDVDYHPGVLKLLAENRKASIPARP